MSKARNLSDFISDPTISTTEIADLAVTHAKLHTTMDLSSKTVTLPSLSQTIVNSSHIQMGGNLDVVGQIGAYDNPGSSWGKMILRATDFELKNAGGTIKMVLDTSGNVGIGTSNPSTMLHLSAGTTNGQGGSDAGITMTNKYDNPDNSWSIKPAIQGVSNTGLEIRDVTDSRSVMVFDGSGNVGINSSNPSAKLTVEGTFSVRTSSNQSFNDSSNANNLTMTDSKAHFNLDGADKDFQISSDTVTHALFVQGSYGNVGIGTSSPSESLHVEGNARLADTASMQWGSSKYQTLTGGGGANDLLYRTYATHIFKTATGASSNTDGTEQMRINGEGITIGTGTGGGNPPSTRSLLFGSDDDRNIQFLGQTASGVEGIIGAWNGVYNFQSSKIVFNKPAGNVGDIQFWTNQGAGPVKRMTIQHNGTILVNRSSNVEDTKMNINHGASWGLVLDGDGSGTDNHIMFNRSGGTRGYITSSSSSVSYSTTSDYRLKENVVDLTGASARVNQLNPSRFNFITDDTNTLVDGFLAHEVATVVPEAITGVHNEVKVWKEDEELPDGVSVGDNKLDDDGNTIPIYQGIDQSKLVPLLTAALQEALAEIAALKTRVEALE